MNILVKRCFAVRQRFTKEFTTSEPAIILLRVGEAEKISDQMWDTLTF